MSTFFCSNSPQFMWDLNGTTSLQLAVAVASIACPVTVLLNILVIVAVKKSTELQNNSNILLSSLAVADLLVGAVSIPLTIALDVLVLRRILSEDIICTIDYISEFVLYTACGASFFHLILIAWERYVAITRLMEYRVIVTRDRVKKCARIAWIAVLITVAPVVIMRAVGVRNEVMLAVDVSLTFFWLLGLLIIVYFYLMAYLGARKHSRRSQIRQVRNFVEAKIENSIACTTFLLSVAVFVSGALSFSVYLFGRVSPYFRKNSIFRWAEILLQLNSLMNPVLYFFRNRRFRKVALELLRFHKPQEQLTQPGVRRTGRRTKRYRDSIASLEFENGEHGAHLTQSCCVAGQASDGAAVMGRRRLALSLESIDDVSDTQQPIKLTVIAQIENTPPSRKRIQGNEQLPNPVSQSGNAFVIPTNCHQNVAEKTSQRSGSALSFPTNFIAPDESLTVVNSLQCSVESCEDTNV